MSYKVTYVEYEAEGETITEYLSEYQLNRLVNGGMAIEILSVEPSDSLQTMIDAEIEAYKNNDRELMEYYERYFDKLDKRG